MARSWQDLTNLTKILQDLHKIDNKIMARSWQDHDKIMVRSWQDHGKILQILQRSCKI